MAKRLKESSSVVGTGERVCRSVMEVVDAIKDARFVQNPLVTSDPNICFYAGALLTVPHGNALGTLCTVDSVPRILTPAQSTALQILAWN